MVRPRESIPGSVWVTHPAVLNRVHLVVLPYREGALHGKGVQVPPANDGDTITAFEFDRSDDPLAARIQVRRANKDDRDSSSRRIGPGDGASCILPVSGSQPHRLR